MIPPGWEAGLQNKQTYQVKTVSPIYIALLPIIIKNVVLSAFWIVMYQAVEFCHKPKFRTSVRVLHGIELVFEYRTGPCDLNRDFDFNSKVFILLGSFQVPH